MRSTLENNDTYHLWVPIEDADLMKSVEVDENGDWIVRGVMTSDDKDEENDVISPEGMDCSYFLEKGWIKYEHGNNPNQFIGEPIAVKVGRFKHPTLDKSVNGVYVEGRLYRNRELAKQAVQTIEDLQKSNTKRRMGWSIEGSVRERCRKTGKIVKSVLRNVVLTMNPVNTMTWVELAKSFAKNHELTIDMPMDKSLDTGEMAEVTPQSVEGGSKKAVPEVSDEAWSRLLRAFVESDEDDIHKSVDSPGSLAMKAFAFAKLKGFNYDDAYTFGAFVKQNHGKIRLLIKSHGGETMSKQTSVLDTALEELEKALDIEAVQDEDELLKSQSSEDDEEDDEEDYEDDSEDYEGDDSEDADEDSDEDSDEEGDGEGFAKSFSKDSTVQQALEVSDFLSRLVDEVGYSIDTVNKSLSSVSRQQSALLKAFKAVGEQLRDLAEENAELKKSFEELLNRPIGRRGVTSTREVQTITKGFNLGPQPMEGKLTRARVLAELNKSFEAGNYSLGEEIMRYEAGVPLENLNLPHELRVKFGLASAE